MGHKLLDTSATRVSRQPDAYPHHNPNQTHNPTPVDRAAFRAQATGVGTTLAKSRATGAARSASVSIPTDQRKALPKHGAGHAPAMPDFMDSEY